MKKKYKLNIKPFLLTLFSILLFLPSLTYAQNALAVGTCRCIETFLYFTVSQYSSSIKIRTFPYFETNTIPAIGGRTPDCIAQFKQYCEIICKDIRSHATSLSCFSVDIEDVLKKVPDFNGLPDDIKDTYNNIWKFEYAPINSTLKLHPVQIPETNISFIEIMEHIKKNWSDYSLVLNLIVIGILLAHFSSSAITAYLSGGATLSLEPIKAAAVASILISVLTSYGELEPTKQVINQNLKGDIHNIYETDDKIVLEIKIKNKPNQTIMIDKSSAKAVVENVNKILEEKEQNISEKPLM